MAIACEARLLHGQHRSMSGGCAALSREHVWAWAVNYAREWDDVPIVRRAHITY